MILWGGILVKMKSAETAFMEGYYFVTIQVLRLKTEGYSSKSTAILSNPIQVS
jgi:hypothetical protein